MENVEENTHKTDVSEILFKIVSIKVYGKNKIVETHAFVDEGSSISLMDESLRQQLEIEGHPSPLCLRWTGGMKRNEKKNHRD